MKVLVTGANGLLGHHVVFELLKRNISVRIIVRNRKNIHFDFNSVEVFDGNFADYTSLKLATQSCDGIIHIAAVTDTNLIHYEDYEKINVTGTVLVLKVAKELNIKRIVYVSSSNTIGFGREQALADECFDIQFPFTESFYARSKVESEQLFIEASKNADNHYIIINPTFMIGAFDTKPSSGKLILLAYKKRLMFSPKGGKNFVAVRAVAEAICNALTFGKNGERYLAAGVNISFKEFYKHQKQICNYKQINIGLPNALLVGVGKVGDLFRNVGIKTDICSMNLRQLLIQEYYVNKKARSELNLPETDLEIAIKDAIEWFKEQKMV
jgi:dihydroflavonol-4-reductase